jgi:hypothetical protein
LDFMALFPHHKARGSTMASFQRLITFPEPLRVWVQKIADQRGIPFATAATQLLQSAKEGSEALK